MVNNKFSVIIPFYNAQDFLKETILSVIDTEYKNIELILIDDGSTDHSYDICLGLTRSFSDVKFLLFKQSNQGPNVARNLGIDKASGDYVVFIDADDLIDKNCFRKLNESINGHDYICYGIDFFDNETRNTISKRVPHYKSYDNKEVVSEVFGNNSLLGVCWNKCISLNFINNNNIRFTPDKLHGRDILFSRECALYSNSVLSIDSILCHSRFHRGSFSRSFSYSNILSAIDLAEKHLNIFSGRVEDFKVKSAIKKHLDYILFLSSFRSKNFQSFKEHYLLIEKAKEELDIINRSSNLRQRVISIYLSSKIMAWCISRVLLSVGYKPY